MDVHTTIEAAVKEGKDIVGRINIQWPDKTNLKTLSDKISTTLIMVGRLGLYNTDTLETSQVNALTAKLIRLQTAISSFLLSLADFNGVDEDVAMSSVLVFLNWMLVVNDELAYAERACEGIQPQETLPEIGKVLDPVFPSEPVDRSDSVEVVYPSRENPIEVFGALNERAASARAEIITHFYVNATELNFNGDGDPYDEGNNDPVSFDIKEEIVRRVQWLRTGSTNEMDAAAESLLDLVRDAKTIQLLAEAGDLELWVKLLGDGTGTENTRAIAAWALVDQTTETNQSIVKSGAIPLLVHMFMAGSVLAKMATMYAVLYLLLRNDTAIFSQVSELGTATAVVPMLWDGSERAKHLAAGVLLLLSVDERNQSAIIAANAIHALVALLREGIKDAQGCAVGVLMRLMLDVENRKTIADSGAILPLVQLLEDGTDGAKQAAAGALANLAVDAENRKAIVIAGAIHPLVELLRDGTESTKGHAAGALWNLAADAEIKKTIATAGAIPHLVQLLKVGTQRAKEQAAGALENLAADAENRKSIVTAGAVHPLVQLLRNGTDGAKEHAAGTLGNLVIDDENRNTIAVAGTIPPLVQVLRGCGTGASVNAIIALSYLGALGAGVRATIIAENAVPLLVQLLTESLKSAQVLKEQHTDRAVVLLAYITCDRPGAIMIVSVGAVPLLTKLLKQQQAPIERKNNIVRALSNLVLFDKSVVPTLAKEKVEQDLQTVRREGSEDDKRVATELLKKLRKSASTFSFLFG